MWCIFCGLADARMSASEKNLPVLVCFRNDFNPFCQPSCAAAAAVYFCCPVLKDTSRNLTSKYQRCYLVIVSGYKKHSNLCNYSEVPNRRACSLKFFRFSFQPARNFSCSKQKIPPCSSIDLLS